MNKSCTNYTGVRRVAGTCIRHTSAPFADAIIHEARERSSIFHTEWSECECEREGPASRRAYCRRDKGRDEDGKKSGRSLLGRAELFAALREECFLLGEQLRLREATLDHLVDFPLPVLRYG